MRRRERVRATAPATSARSTGGSRSGCTCSCARAPTARGTFRSARGAGLSERARDGLQAAIADACGESLGVHQMGNAPLGHMEVADDTLFLWRFQHVSGDVDAEESGVDYAWLTKEEPRSGSTRGWEASSRGWSAGRLSSS